jgi:hypothetical protein
MAVGEPQEADARQEDRRGIAKFSKLRGAVMPYQQRHTPTSCGLHHLHSILASVQAPEPPGKMECPGEVCTHPWSATPLRSVGKVVSRRVLHCGGGN